MNDQKVELGDRVKDLITGIEGIAISHVSYLHGCSQFAVKQKANKDGIVLKAEWVDEPQLEVLQKGVIKPWLGIGSFQVEDTSSKRHGGNREYPR